MSRHDLWVIADDLARSLESAIPLCTTRIEHIRVSSHAARARAIADQLGAIQEPLAPQTTGN